MTAAAVANFAQLEPGFGSEVGILLKHGDCKRDFIDDALTGAMAAGEQFKVLKRVVAPVPVNVVDGFLGEKLSPDVLLHDEAMFENRVFLSGDARRNGHDPIAVSFLVSGEAFSRCESVPESFSRDNALVCFFARLVAVLLLPVKTAPWFTAFDLRFPASKAVERMRLFGFATATRTGASVRAVVRVVTKSLPVCGQVALHHDEGLSAFLAGKVDGSSAGGGNVFAEPMRATAGKAAVLPAFLNIARVAVKRLSAVFTFLLDGHGKASCLTTGISVHPSFVVVK